MPRSQQSLFARYLPAPASEPQGWEYPSSEAAFGPHEADDDLEHPRRLGFGIGGEIHHEEICPPVGGIAGHNLVRRNRHPFFVEPREPTIFRMAAVAG
jgi:hypothetical protein